jgi:plastocyanin domain-containing protein
MRSRLKLVIVLLLCLVGIGFWRGWFSVSSPKSDTEGDKVNVNMSVDKGKIKSDIKKVERKVEKGVSELEGKGKAAEAK